MKINRVTSIMLTVLVACLLASGTADAQTFGRNKVQYRSFDWRIIHTAHFDVYFYEGSEDLADAVSRIVEDANTEFERVLGHELTTVIPVIIYASHNDFSSTNISASHIEETVGGFTELYKNRVVIPFTGSYDDLRHVLYHELTHVFLFDIVYGGLVDSVIRQAYTNPVPLWFVEGIAEYMSMGWDPEAEMILRDLAVSDLVVPLEYLYGGYLVYKQGQAVVNFIAERYGEEKIREIVRAIAKTHNLEQALQETIGLSTSQLSEEFEDAVQERYWPEITEREDREDVVDLITDHRKDGSYFNFGPSISPDGKSVIFVSDRTGYAGVYVASTLDGAILGKYVSGESTDEFEALHILRTGFGWSPDGSEIAFVAKAGERDALHFIDTEERKVVRSFRFELDGAFTPAWSPDGERIVFVGTRHGASDLYMTDRNGAEPRKLTDDYYDERDPEWSPDGTRIVFSSDRSSPEELGFKRDYDLYTLDPESLEVVRIVATPGREGHPTWSPDGSYVAYTSDVHGSPGIYIASVADSMSVLTTTLVGGAKAPSWARDADWAAFQVYGEGGWDIAVAKNPMERFSEVIAENGWFPSVGAPLDVVLNGIVAVVEAEGGEVTDEKMEVAVERLGEMGIGEGGAEGESSALAAAGVAAGAAYAASGPDPAPGLSPEPDEGAVGTPAAAESAAGPPDAETPDGPADAVSASGPEDEPDAYASEHGDSGEVASDATEGEPEDGPASADATDEGAATGAAAGAAAAGASAVPPPESETVTKARDAFLKATGNDVFEPEEEPDRDEHIVERYRPRFAPDWITGGLSYSSAYGFAASAEISISDVLGNHRFYIVTDIFASIEASNFYVEYSNLSNRWNWSVGVFHFKESYYSDRTQLGEYLGKKRYFTERNYGVTSSVRYPFSKFTRMEIGLSVMSVDRQYAAANPEGIVELTDEKLKRQLLVPSVRLVNDTTTWGSVGPVAGRRFSIAVSKGWDPGGSFDYLTGTLDFREYMRLGKRHTLAVRLLGARSSSRDAQYFYLGGINGLRGYDDFFFHGHNLGFVSLELRMPFIDRLDIAAPLPLSLWGLRGVVFLDAGAAWDGNNFRGLVSGPAGRTLGDIRAAYGFGLRMRFSYFVLRFDWAWPTDGRTSGPMRTHFALGGEF
jgi:hypothetical protein